MDDGARGRATRVTGLAEVVFGEPSLVYCGDVKRIAADLRERVESKPSGSGCTEETNAQKNSDGFPC